MLLYYLCYEICIISCTVHWKFLVTNLAKVNILLCYPKYRILSFHRKKHENYSIHYNNIPLNALCFDFRNWYRRSNISWPRSVRLLTTTRWPPLQFFISYRCPNFHSLRGHCSDFSHFWEIVSWFFCLFFFGKLIDKWWCWP